MRFWNVALVLLAPYFGCTTATDHAATLAHDPTSALVEQPAVHGMLMVGRGPVYLSHLSMPHGPDDAQVLLEVELLKTGSDPLFTYVQDRQVTGEKIYTVVPEPFVLSELFTPKSGPARRTFKAKVFRGHFGWGGAEFLANVTFKVKRVVFAQRFDAKSTPLGSLQYLVFGNQQELFAAHVLNKESDFEQVLSVRIKEGILNEGQAAAVHKGAFLRLVTGANGGEQVLRTGDERDAEVRVGRETLPVWVEVLDEVYGGAGEG